MLQWFINFLIRKISGSGIKNENISNKDLAEANYTNLLLENSRKESTLTSYRQYLGCSLSKYALNK